MKECVYRVLRREPEMAHICIAKGVGIGKSVAYGSVSMFVQYCEEHRRIL
jgi:hypothetical protein